MQSHPSLNQPEVEHHPGYPPSDIELPLIEKSPLSPPSTWLSDTADLLVLLCYFLFITASSILLALTFLVHSGHIPALSSSGYLTVYIIIYLQRGVAISSLPITTAVMMVIGKRYVLFKLAREGLRSRRVAIYSNPSISNLASHLVLHGMELPLLGLSAIWVLALVTSSAVYDIWELGSTPSWMTPPNLSGPLNPGTAGSSYVLAATEQLGIIISHLCLGESDVTSELPIQVTSNASVSTDHPTGGIYYPAPTQGQSRRDIAFSYPTTMNSFDLSMEQLSSIPSTAEKLACTNNNIVALKNLELWSAGSDNQTLSIIIVDASSIIRFNATAVIASGTLSSTGDQAEFISDGTSRPNVMTGTQWAQDITTIICNTTSPARCENQQSLFDFAYWLTQQDAASDSDLLYQVVNSALNTALGAYSSVLLPAYAFGTRSVRITIKSSAFAIRNWIYVLAANILVSAAMLIRALRLHLASPLRSDFINSTRLLLDPLKNPELFSASLDKTVEALADPYMLVKDNSVFLLADSEDKSAKHRRGWRKYLKQPVQEEHELSIPS